MSAEDAQRTPGAGYGAGLMGTRSLGPPKALFVFSSNSGLPEFSVDPAMAYPLLGPACCLNFSFLI